MKKQFVISVMSKDRPGIIADVTGAILELEGDLADLNQSVLGGYFSMILIAEFAEKVTPEDLMARLSHIRSDTMIEAIIRRMEIPLEIEKQQLPSETFVVTAQASNRKGLVNVLGEFFRGRMINILDLVTTRDKDLYTMIFQVDLSDIPSFSAFQSEIDKLAEQTGMELMVQHNDIFRATHEINTLQIGNPETRSEKDNAAF